MNFQLILYVLIVNGASYGLITEVDVDQLQQDVVNMRAQMTEMQLKMHTLERQLNATSDLAALANSYPHHAPVAFTATLTTTINNLPAHLHVAFDHEITNVGGAYNSKSGHFRAPVFGVYAFFVTTTNVPGQSVSLTLMVNGEWKAVTLAHGSAATASQWETSTMNAMSTMNAGDEAWVQNEAQFSPVESLDGFHYSAFSGFLVQTL